MLRLLPVLAVLAFVATMVSAATSPTVAATPDGRSVRLATFNIYGNVGHQGRADWVPDAVDEVLRPAPTALALQEACRNQAQEFADRLGGRMEFLTLMPHRCDNGADFGDAVVYRGPANGTAVRRILPGLDEEDEPRGLICVPLRPHGRPMMFCSVHLSLDPGRRLAQTTVLADAEAGRRPDTPPLGEWGQVVLAGDFNAEPTSRELDPLYDTIGAMEALGPRGRFAQPTHGDGKIDYIFTWRAKGSFEYTNAIPCRYSDHSLYTSEFTF
ncbi:endonuclease/exonuclease/phosphatase family protein [Actinocrispum wychmicini]|uniref:Endonuclease/exonuclease/phosphatase family metal-dependent hydrolase n=1 Tax=Actinocrispum wychmicini TaxID=1213861 RepID=A0A4R2JV06_9PSEU|nr:endonuclease/exonuclease/phosphatase family protein [Actinocrispum wychmicini]TCO60879.1 endonuclease/exonuclease/phosphatase family metal-dependent hydrolase [Actinocrispum wychmicini]